MEKMDHLMAEKNNNKNSQIGQITPKIFKNNNCFNLPTKFFFID
jgi:hypothetical protein